MDFTEKTKITGHLEILKIDRKEGKTEVVYDDPNVITGGLGRSIAQFMNISGCVPDPCAEEADEEESAVRDACDISPYQIRYFQIGTGADAIDATSSVKSLVSPLTAPQYGNSLRSVDILSGILYSEASASIGPQTFVQFATQGVVGSSLVSVVYLDEETANGQLLNEVGLFVDNPYLKTASFEDLGLYPTTFSLLGQEGNPPSPNVRTEHEQPGHLLAAYKQFPDIRKESYFSLVVRWKINFSVEAS